MCWWRDPQSTTHTSLLRLSHSCLLLNAAVFIFIFAQWVCILRKQWLHNTLTLTGCADFTNLCLYAACPLPEFSLLPTFTHYKCIYWYDMLLPDIFFYLKKKKIYLTLFILILIISFSIGVTPITKPVPPKYGLSRRNVLLCNQILKIKFLIYVTFKKSGYCCTLPATWSLKISACKRTGCKVKNLFRLNLLSPSLLMWAPPLPLRSSNVLQWVARDATIKQHHGPSTTY